LQENISTPPPAVAGRAFKKKLLLQENISTPPPAAELEESLKTTPAGEYINTTTCCRLEESLRFLLQKNISTPPPVAGLRSL
jgi:hypothetical protein